MKTETVEKTHTTAPAVVKEEMTGSTPEPPADKTPAAKKGTQADKATTDPPPEKTPATEKTLAKVPKKSPSTDSLLNSLPPDAAKAVQDCLNRQSTQQLLGSTRKPTTTAGTPSPSPPGPSVSPGGPSTPEAEHENPAEEEEEEEEDPEELARKEALAKIKRKAHARYMRFSRSLTSHLT